MLLFGCDRWMRWREILCDLCVRSSAISARSGLETTSNNESTQNGKNKGTSSTVTTRTMAASGTPIRMKSTSV